MAAAPVASTSQCRAMRRCSPALLLVLFCGFLLSTVKCNLMTANSSLASTGAGSATSPGGASFGLLLLGATPAANATDNGTRAKTGGAPLSSPKPSPLRIQGGAVGEDSTTTTLRVQTRPMQKLGASRSPAHPRLPDDVEGTPPLPVDEVISVPAKVVSRVLVEWDEFKKRNNKTYFNRNELNRMARMARARGMNASVDTLSDEDRMNLFIARKVSIEEHNKHGRFFKRSLNAFADMTTQEVIGKHTGLVLAGHKPKGTSYDPRVHGRGVAQLPRRFDWRERGALTEPRNQGPCGCCWAFAATAAMEAKNFIRTKKLVALSEQHLLDCDTIDDKCEGGTPWDAFDWLQGNGGQEENEKYPYEVYPDKCRQDKNRMYRLTVRGYMSVRPATEDSIMLALYLEGPLTVAVNALPTSFQDYQEGIYTDPECSSSEDDLHHSMLLVGWGEDTIDGPYWTLRNSWGRDWGEGGYIRVSRKDNMCGVMTYVVFPSLE